MTLQAGGEGAGGEGVFSLFALNALYVSADTIACIASLWVLSARTDHALQVGVILGLGALLPPLLGRIRRASPRVDETRILLLARGLGLVICLAAVPLAENLGVRVVAYAVLLVFSLAGACTVFSVETISGTLAMRLPRERHALIARAQMLGVQFAMFAGAAVSGFSFQWFGYFGALVIAAAVSALGLAVQWMASSVLVVPSRDAAVVTAKWCASEPPSSDRAFTLLMLLGVLVGVFNFLAPFLMHHERRMGFADYAILEILCIVGSLGAIGAYTRWALASLRDGVLTAMLLAGFLVFWIGSTPWMLLAGAFIGFSLSALRIKQRARLLLRLRCPDDARSWGGRMAMQTVLQRALLPVVLGALLQVSTPSRVFVGSVLPAFLLIGLVLHRKQHAMT